MGDFMKHTDINMVPEQSDEEMAKKQAAIEEKRKKAHGRLLTPEEAEAARRETFPDEEVKT